MQFKGAIAVVTITMKPQMTEAIHKSLASDVMVSVNDDGLVMTIDASELSKLRANINSNLRLIKSALDTFREVDEA
jgi:tRNA threonylcarbamoyladenosine modification (KEOPS) complex  Pcc1 subunit